MRVGPVLVAAMFVAATTLGATTASLTREQALTALADPHDAAARRRAVLWFAQEGTMADLPALVRALHDADPVVRGLAEQAMWNIWSRSGDRETDRLLARGVEQLQAEQLPAAIVTFSRMITRAPDFAEGWNKRATAYYLLGEYEKSLADCAQVLMRNPYHFGALSGAGMNYLRLGQPARALTFFERALTINPNLDSVRLTVTRLRELLRGAAI